MTSVWVLECLLLLITVKEYRRLGYHLSSSFKKTRTSNHLQMSLQDPSKGTMFSSVFETMSVGPVWVEPKTSAPRSWTWVQTLHLCTVVQCSDWADQPNCANVTISTCKPSLVNELGSQNSHNNCTVTSLSFSCDLNSVQLFTCYSIMILFIQADVTTPKLKDYHERLQTFLLWFIDGSSYIGTVG